MYLPTIMKVQNERLFSGLGRYSKMAVPAGLWFNWILYNHLYNFYYSEISIPAKGVPKREESE